LRLIRSENKNQKSFKKVPFVELFYYDKKKWGERNKADSNKILLDLNEYRSRRESSFNKLYMSPQDNTKIEELLKKFSSGIYHI
jgi:hypothetical protein